MFRSTQVLQTIVIFDLVFALLVFLVKVLKAQDYS